MKLIQRTAMIVIPLFLLSGCTSSPSLIESDEAVSAFLKNDVSEMQYELPLTYTANGKSRSSSTGWLSNQSPVDESEAVQEWLKMSELAGTTNIELLQKEITSFSFTETDIEFTQSDLVYMVQPEDGKIVYFIQGGLKTISDGTRHLYATEDSAYTELMEQVTSNAADLVAYEVKNMSY